VRGGGEGGDAGRARARGGGGGGGPPLPPRAVHTSTPPSWLATSRAQASTVARAGGGVGPAAPAEP